MNIAVRSTGVARLLAIAAAAGALAVAAAPAQASGSEDFDTRPEIGLVGAGGCIRGILVGYTYTQDGLRVPLCYVVR